MKFYRFYLYFLALLGCTSADPAKHGAPRIVEHPESLHVAEHQPATLNCVAEGEPAPIITWYANGQPIVTSNEDPTSHRMVLPSGQLFFLRVTTNKTHKGDVGMYYCLATNPETNVSVASRVASLEIAVLGTEFRQQPKSVDVAVGMTALLECKPPWGEPEPKVKWKKDGDVVRGERVEVSDAGSLRIRDARKEDSGIYFCVAFNSAGQRDSLPVRIFIKEKPRIVEGPKDALVAENSDATFHCRAAGDPEPTILWKRIDSQIPPRRLVILNDKSLRIERTQLSDSGIYACRAENPFGFQEAEAKLTVHSQPSFIVTPRDKTVGIGRRVTFKCSVTGNPTPAVFWNKESSKVLMFPKQDYGRMSVLDDGTLIIDNVEKSDAGDYVCKGLSFAGSAYAKAKLEVKDFDSRPPPIINHAPQNQTLPSNTVAILHCTASGDPPPIIKWFKNGRSVNIKDDRYNIHDSGTLQINDLRKSDSGEFTCKAMSETGEASKTCTLHVDVHTNPSIIFHRTPEPSTFPGPPSKPSILEITETSVRLTWRNNQNQGSSPVQAYTVEYFSHETGEGWIVASDSIKEQVYVVRELQPDTLYMFLVRAQNSHGLSLPSHVTAPIRTKGSNVAASKPTLSSVELDMVAEKLSNHIITLFPPDVLGSTAIKLTWEVRKNHRFIEGFHIRYKALPELNEHLADKTSWKSSPSNYSVVTLESNTATAYTLNNLEKNTWYEIDVQPYHKDILGEESNTIRTRTLEDVPSAAPQNIRADMIDNTTLYISWEPPPKQHYNGLLKGFKIYIFGNESKFDREIQINSTLEAVYIQNMIQDMAYKIQMSAYNRIGEGFRSEPILIGPLSIVSPQNVANQVWFVATMIVVGVFLWIFLCILSVWLFRKKKKCKEDPSKGPASKYTPAANTFNSNKWGKLTSKSYSAMSQNNAHVSSPSYKHCNEAFPASTITPSIIKQQYMIEPKNNEPRDFAKENLSSGSTIDTNLMLDFEDKALEESQQYEQICDSHFIDQQPALFLPPPPEHPPPSDTESLRYNWKEQLPQPEFRVDQSKLASANCGNSLQNTKSCGFGSSSQKHLQKDASFFTGSTNPLKYMISHHGLPLSPQLNNSYVHSSRNNILHQTLNSPMSEVAVVDSESESDANLSHVGSLLTSDIDASGNCLGGVENSDSFSSMDSSDNECLASTTKNQEFSPTHLAGKSNEVKKMSKPRHKSRHLSPCSTDSNYCSISHKNRHRAAENIPMKINDSFNYRQKHLENSHKKFSDATVPSNTLWSGIPQETWLNGHA